MGKFVTLLMTVIAVSSFAAARDSEDDQAYQGFNLHVVDQSLTNGFKLYRSAKPGNADEAKALCKTLGVSEIFVVSGNGASTEKGKYAKECPNLKVVYDEKQKASVPLSAAFLSKFDQWIESARQAGKTVSIRCDAGSHRTGRLAAWYQMKYQGLTAEDASIIMDKHGKLMFLHPQLDNQVHAMEDFLYGRPCSEDKKHCVQ